MKQTAHILTILLLSLALSGLGLAADWSKWRGPFGTGITEESDWNPKALDGAPDILWETNVGVGHSTPSVSGDLLYILGNKHLMTATDTLDIDIVYCMNAITGAEIWRYEYPCPEKGFPGPNASPVLDENRLYTLSWEGDLYCFEAETGSVFWKRNLVDEDLSEVNEWGFAGSPVIVDDMLLLTAGKSGAALNKMTGKTIWQSEKEACGLTTPILYEKDGRRMAIFSSHPEIHGVDIDTGERLWSYEWKTCNDPYIIGENILLTANHNRKQTTLLKLNGTELESLWENRVILGWAFQNQVVIDNVSYALANLRRGRVLQCVDLETGELNWTHDTGDEGALIAADDKLVILEGDGELVVAEINPEEYIEISRARIMTPDSHQGIRQDRRWYCWTLPVLANGLVYGRSNTGDLVCVDMR